MITYLPTKHGQCALCSDNLGIPNIFVNIFFFTENLHDNRRCNDVENKCILATYYM